MTNPRSITTACTAAFTIAALPALAADWPSAGRDLNNSRYQHAERAISPATVGRLALKWTTDTAGDVTAQPAVDGDYLYFPDSAGYLYKVHRQTGVQVWVRRVSDYTGVPGDFARATPAVAGDLLILGNQSGKLPGEPTGPASSPAQVFALNKHTGDPVWNTEVDPTFLSFVTQSAVVVDGLAYVGTASNEELVAAFVPKAYWSWQFRGAALALEVATGRIVWRTHMVPEGYGGGAIWSSTPAVDRAHRLVYMTTGNNYTVPETVQQCLRDGGTPKGCLSPDNHFNSIVALDMKSGAIRWAARGLPYDAWNVGCGLNVPGAGFVVPRNDNCPDPEGPDWDFAQGAMLFGSASGPENQGGNLVGAGQKSGMFWTFNAKTGKPVWSRQIVPPGVTGGLQWGSATNGKRIFVASSNSGPAMNGGGAGALDWVLKDGTTTKAGGWAAMDAKTGAVLWTTADPNGSRAEAAVAGANGVIFGCNVDFARGTLFAMDAGTGAVLWSYDTSATCNAGPSVVDGQVFIGSGNFLGYGNRKLHAFGL
ncbi:MAG: PQQ-binding-like beta-propeller repeat protein [Burkholderiaceae bacterium]|nr:PQQ-binding-like beta-propeller repeat protein [Rhodoferax sp.]MCP5285236.1 PQQ-binding-like beta-propeller repeat protein [Burkholderiaceae bacterium]